jgi:methyl-accepting chemotaxis protein
MRGLRVRLTLNIRLILIIVPITIVIIAGISAIGFRISRNGMENQREQTFEVIADTMSHGMDQTFNYYRELLHVVSKHRGVIASAQLANEFAEENGYTSMSKDELATIYDSKGNELGSSFVPDSDQLKNTQSFIMAYADEIPSVTEVYFTNRYGHVVEASYKPEVFDQSNEQWWQEAMQIGESSQTLRYDERYKVHNFSLNKAIRDPETAEPIGVLKIVIDISKLGLVGEQFGTTGECYLVGEDKLMLTESRFLSKLEVPTAILQQKADTIGVRRALSGMEGFDTYADYLGEPVIGYYKPVSFLKMGWAVLVEQSVNESYTDSNRLLLASIIVTIIGGVVVTAFIVFAAGRISRPIKRISNQVAKVAEGDLTVAVPTNNRQDEVGALTQSFNQMIQSLQGTAAVMEQVAARDLTAEAKLLSERDVMGKALKRMLENLRNQVKEIVTSADSLASSSSEILATTTQLASGASETATSVSETTTTVEEVRQTAQVSNEKARSISESAQKTAEISRAGEKSTEDTIQEMNRIKEQMDSMADSVVQLSEQSQAIGEIISTVDDITEQSNLLSVNAAIEAAKAGEHGKGFAVVASEIKTLSEQSKRSTAQVRTILSEIQKATSTAVMMAEQGSKAAEAGVNQSNETGESIKMLASSVVGAAQSAVQIAASSQQQLAGMDQIATAMENINQTSTQTATGMKQLQTSAQDLNELGQRMKQLIEQYKL